MTQTQQAALRSFLTTLITTFLALVPVASVVEGDFTWAGAALLSAFVASARTVVAALDPGNTSFGFGAVANAVIDEVASETEDDSVASE